MQMSSLAPPEEYDVTNQMAWRPSAPHKPGLYLVATPIGNLGDITLRALDVLRSADWIAAEDTRNSQVLLNAYGIKTRLVACHDHNEDELAERCARDIQAGKIIALISDAGMPIIADPGFKIVQHLAALSLYVTAIPGANAALMALQLSNLPPIPHSFQGFLPNKSGLRQKHLQSVRPLPATLIFYESPHRLLETLADIQTIMPDRIVVVARELTKKFEDVKRGTAAELLQHFQQHAPRGEIVLLIAPPTAQDFVWDADTIKSALRDLQTLSSRDAAAEIAALSGWTKRDVYQLALELRDDKTEPH